MLSMSKPPEDTVCLWPSALWEPEALRLSAGSQEADTSASKSWHLVWVVPESLLKVREKRGEEAETFSGGNTTSRAPGAGVSASWDRDGKEGSSRGVGLGVQDWVPAPAVSGKCCCLMKTDLSSPVAIAEFSRFAGILSAALSQHHLSAAKPVYRNY